MYEHKGTDARLASFEARLLDAVERIELLEETWKESRMESVSRAEARLTALQQWEMVERGYLPKPKKRRDDASSGE